MPSNPGACLACRRVASVTLQRYIRACHDGLMRYYEFMGGWVKETVEGGHLVRRLYTADPRVNARAKLDNVAEFDGETEEASRRFREGHVMGDGQIQWGTWEPV